MSDVQPLRDNVAKLSKEVEDLKRMTSEEQARLAEQRRSQAELKEKDEQLKALAALALKHLGDHCPVCAQTYDRDTTRRRLENLARSRTEADQPGCAFAAAPRRNVLAHTINATIAHFIAILLLNDKCRRVLNGSLCSYLPGVIRPPLPGPVQPSSPEAGAGVSDARWYSLHGVDLLRPRC
jgi:hypothetical protein